MLLKVLILSFIELAKVTLEWLGKLSFAKIVLLDWFVNWLVMLFVAAATTLLLDALSRLNEFNSELVKETIFGLQLNKPDVILLNERL
ncbi:unnamed protein product [Adineta ricciae]|uniref:Uncharacterized protein n=1 Tax=Adineta ricciae TaxID=249248 RepID=A0A815WNA1_ADIRI|nr:unnamed protein product [Adineta ricciae]